MAATATKAKAASPMDALIKDFVPERYIPGELVDGTVITAQKNLIILDLDGYRTGIILGRETKDAANTVKELRKGDTVAAVVLDPENEDGFVVLSFRKASQEKTWHMFMDAFENDTVIKVKPTEANKGGLLLDYDGIKGFIPVSQLAPLHYPRVNGADAAKILTKLKELIGVELDVNILNLDRENGKLILSEKAAFIQDREKTLAKLVVGQKMTGKISGIVKFGIFVTFGQVEGLVHVSEIEWGHCKDTSQYGKVGDEVEVLVIGIENGKISLSMKRLTENPWDKVEAEFPLGTKVKKKITKVTPFGVFIELADQLNGLIHISELYQNDEEQRDPTEVFSAGEEIDATVISVDKKEHRIALSVREDSAARATGDEEAADESEEASE